MSSSTPIFTALFWACAAAPSRQHDNIAATAAFGYLIVSSQSNCCGNLSTAPDVERKKSMPKRKPVRGIDHLGITVPDLDAASRFFEEAFDAKPLFDNIKRSDTPFAGPEAEAMVGLAPGAVLVTMRMMQLGNGPGLELFEVHGPDQRPAVRF